MTAEQLDLVDAGLDDLMASAVEDGFNDSAVKPHSFYEIFTPPYECVPSPEQRIPSFMVGGGTYYDGTEFDQYNTKGDVARYQDPDSGAWIVHKKDGRSAVFAAEMVIS